MQTLTLIVLMTPAADLGSPIPLEQRVTELEKRVAALEKKAAPAAAPKAIQSLPMFVEPAPSSSFSGVVPPGMHAHRRTDGTVIVHGDHQYGDPNAHAGVAAPWVQIAGPGQFIPPTMTGQPVQYAPAIVNGPMPIAAFGPTIGSGCPGGVCPANQSFAPAGGLFGRLRGR